MVDIDPKEIKGPWDKGYALDRHTISSTMIGYNEFGYPEFDTQRSALGELVYRLKYRADENAAAAIAETIANFVKTLGVETDVVVPVPPSKQRPKQPLFAIAERLGRLLGIPADTNCIVKIKPTPQMKDVGDYSERLAALNDAFSAGASLAAKNVLLVDDLFQSGATMTVVARAITAAGAKSICAIALTRTRS